MVEKRSVLLLLATENSINDSKKDVLGTTNKLTAIPYHRYA